MIVFWLRFIVFCLLWAMMIFQYSENPPASILAFAIATTLFFFLSIRTPSVYLYISLTIVIFVHGFLFTDEGTYTFLMLLYITIFASFKMKEMHFPIYASSNLFLSMALCFFKEKDWMEQLIIGAFFYFVVIVLNLIANARNEQRKIYDELLGEYRQLKRMHVTSEREARLEERTKIARDIHDSVGHRLTAFIIKLEMLSIQKGDANYICHCCTINFDYRSC